MLKAQMAAENPPEIVSWRNWRWGDGFQCPRCGETERWGRIRTRELFQCNACQYQCSVTAGTILQDTKLLVQTWFLAAYLITTTKKGISGPELARKLGINPESGHYLQQKIFRVLRTIQGRKLFGDVEVDECYVGGKRPGDKRGRGTSKAKVICLIEHRGTQAGRLRLFQVKRTDGATIKRVLEHCLAPGTRIISDGWRGYLPSGFEHDMRVQEDPKEAARDLPWIHTSFSNLKRVQYGTHAYTSTENNRPYLDAFEYRHNHRNHLGDGFKKALKAMAKTKPWPEKSLKIRLPQGRAAG